MLPRGFSIRRAWNLPSDLRDRIHLGFCHIALALLVVSTLQNWWEEKWDDAALDVAAAGR
jgi:hypothetical protein